MDAGFVRYTHRRCEDCDIREDLHASGSPLPKRRHNIARCKTCGGKGELPLDKKSGVDPYAGRVPPGRAQFYESKRAKRAHDERHRFRAYTHLFEECEEAMQIPPGGFNYGRTKTDEGAWAPLESEGYASPSFKHYAESIAHGTRTRYIKRQCRCFLCRRANAEYERSRSGTPIGRAQIELAQVYAREAYSQQGSPPERNVAAVVSSIGAQPTYLDAA